MLTDRCIKNWLSSRICGCTNRREDGLEGTRSHPGTPVGQDGVTTLHRDRESPRMRIQTNLNRVEKFKPFVYGAAHLEEREGGPALIVAMRPRKNGKPHCSGCGRRGRTYDRLEERRF